jgi:outer membrane protein OmpA-like peptidoglycan-associated protein
MPLFLLLALSADAAPMAGPTAALAGGYLFIDPDEEISSAWAVVPRLGYAFGPRVGIEAELGVHGGQVASISMPYTGLSPRLNLMIDMAPDHWLQPFFVGGPGIFWKRASPQPGQVVPKTADQSRFVRKDPATQQYVAVPNTDPLASFGAGLLVRMDGPWFFRLDGRAFLHWGEDEVGYAQGFANWEVTGGLAFRGGELRRDSDDDGFADRVDPCPAEAEDFDNFRDDDGCPDKDNDRDGVPDAKDSCPDEEEDRDGVEDEDGCPDDDNDGDGVPDWTDACPSEPEDRDGVQDEDGCPDLDNDQDGIPDDRDRCPAAAEDVDGFEDADGCPDEDNDADGIPDKRDQCPGEAETLNGVDDTDGCPDNAPPPPDIFNGVIRGINFEPASAQLTVESYKVLDDVADILLKYAYIRVEVQGHTDSDGPDAANLDLSARRARSVVEYLIKRGVDPDRLEYVGYGESKPLGPNSSKALKAVNRRVEFHRLDQGPSGR